MLLSDFRSVSRNVLRNKTASVISILGLGIGLGCIIVLLALIIHERSFDTFIPDNQNVYRIIFGNSSQTYYPLAESMQAEFPEVENFFRYYQGSSLQMKTPEDEIVRIQNFGFADSSVFRIMGVKFLNGGPANTISEVAISDEMAMRYFGNLSVQGSVLPVKFTDGFTELIVTGVFKSFPSNSTLNPSFIAEIDLSERLFRQFQRNLGDYGNEEMNELDWRFPEFLSYVVLQKGTDPEVLASKMEKYKEFMNIENIDNTHFRLQPVAEIYLGSGDIDGAYYLRRGNPVELTYYEIISFLILIISVTNYVLLARAGVSQRFHELGTRKIFGASWANINRLVIIESNFIVLISLIPATFLIDYGMDFINTTLNKTLTNNIFLSPKLILLLILVVILTGTLSGWLIGLRYSRVPALKLISGRTLRNDRSKRWNYSFLVLHFTIFMILVTGVFAVSKQIKYLMSGYKGINPNNVLVADLNSDELKKSFPTICDEIKRVPGVEMVAGGSFIPPFNAFLPVNLAVVEGERVRFDGLIMGEGMTELLGIEVVDGSSFGPYKPGVNEILVNESTAKQYNVKAGELILVFKVRGIVKDFNAHSLHSPIQPMVILQQNPERMGLIAIKTSGSNDEAVIKRLKELYTQISPDEIFEVRHLTDVVDGFYTRERDQARIIGAFSLLATVLSVMGLFGISLISISKRKNEIGIRKVNGSSATEVVLLLNSDFLKWVFLAIVISLPASLYLLSIWMERFAYKTKMSWWIFALAGLSAILVAVLTVSWQSWRAAKGNPIEALRYE
jgi:putative ABC transport system permease protein